MAIMVKKRVRNAVLGCSLKNDRMIPVRFQGKPFNITVIQVYAPTRAYFTRRKEGDNVIMKGFIASLDIRDAKIGTMKYLKISNCLKTCPTGFPGAQRASLHTELPKGLLKVNSYSSMGFNLLEADVECTCWYSVSGKSSWKVPICS